jgi:hypothetical protein
LNEVQSTLSQMIKSGKQTSPAMNTLINDYAKYHAIMVILGGSLVLILVLLSMIFWTKFKRIPKINKLRWEFEKKVYFSFGILSSIVASLMLLIVVANVTNTINPLHGFSLIV